MKRIVYLMLAIFTMAVLSMEVSSRTIDKTIIVDGQEIEISFRVKKSDYFAKNELPRLIENIGEATWYVCEIGNDVDPAIAIAKVENGKIEEYYEVDASQYDDFPLSLIGDMATLIMDLKGGETIATDDSVCWGEYCSSSPIMGKMKMLKTKTVKRPVMDQFGIDSDTYMIFRCGESVATVGE